jgi:ABC-type oligopeptide transport system ATPase subunit
MAEARDVYASRPAVLDVRDLKKHFPIRKGLLQRAAGTVFAVDGVSFSIAPSAAKT